MKLLPQLLYGALIWGFGNLQSLEISQDKFVCQLLIVQPSTSSTVVRTELSLLSITTLVYKTTINYWLKIIFCTSPGLLTSVYGEMKCSSVLRFVISLGFSVEYLRTLGFHAAKLLIKQRLLDQRAQTDVGVIGNLRTSILHRQLSPSPLTPSAYFTSLRNCKYRKVFTRACLDILPLAILEGYFNRIPYRKIVCSCDQKAIEDLSHVTFQCTRYEIECNRFLQTIIFHFPGRLDQEKLVVLTDRETFITLQMARFVTAIMKDKKMMGHADHSMSGQ